MVASVQRIMLNANMHVYLNRINHPLNHVIISRNTSAHLAMVAERYEGSQ